MSFCNYIPSHGPRCGRGSQRFPTRRLFASALFTCLFNQQEVNGLDMERYLAFEAGPVILRPHVGVESEFNDNILYDDSSRNEGDLINSLEVGFGAQMGKTGKFKFEFDYTFDQNLYLDRSDLNGGNHFWTLASAYHGAKVEVTGQDSIAFLTEVLGGTTSLREPVDRWTFSDDYRVEYRFSPKTLAHAGFRYSAVDYEEGKPLYDSNTLRGTLGGGYLPGSKTTFLVEGYYGQTASTPNFAVPKPPHLTFIGAFGGVRGKFTEKLGGLVKGGYELREFAGSSETLSSPVFDISLDYRMTEKSTLLLSYARGSGVSVETYGDSYVLDSVTLRALQKLGRRDKWEASFGGSYGFYAYENLVTGRERNDSYWRLELQLNYRMQKWLTGGVGVSHEDFASDLQGIIDYGVNRVTLNFSVGY